MTFQIPGTLLHTPENNLHVRMRYEVNGSKVCWLTVTNDSTETHFCQLKYRAKKIKHFARNTEGKGST